MPKKITTEDFIKMSCTIHGDRYDYSKVVYKKSRENVVIICKEHGEFLRTPNDHLNGTGCNRCGYARRNVKLIQQCSETFISRSMSKHGNRYDYTKVVYTNAGTRVKILCPEHGEFEQTPDAHLAGQGCPECGRKRGGESRFKTAKETIIRRFREIHGDTYEYDKVQYVGSDFNVTITCKDHGDFEQTPSNHLGGKGCSKCGQNGPSKPEIEVYEFIRKLSVDAQHSDRQLLGGKELDVYIPSKMIAVEFNGIYWHSSGDKARDQDFRKSHIYKTVECEKKGVRLYHIFENEWNEKRDLWQSVLCNALGKSPDRVFARQCNIVDVSPEVATSFLEDNHLQGACGSSVRLGLEYQGVLVSLMTFGKPRFDKHHDWELIRFCNLKFTNVVGGASRLLKAFKNYRSGTIVSYANRRWSDGGLYETLGFTLMGISEPTYYYISPNCSKVYHRSTFMKHKLGAILDRFDPNISEVDNMYAHGYRRIWDCGSKVYSLS